MLRGAEAEPLPPILAEISRAARPGRRCIPHPASRIPRPSPGGARARGGDGHPGKGAGGKELPLQSWGEAPRRGALHRAPVSPCPLLLAGEGAAHAVGAAGVMGSDCSSVLLEITIAML